MVQTAAKRLDALRISSLSAKKLGPRPTTSRLSICLASVLPQSRRQYGRSHPFRLELTFTSLQVLSRSVLQNIQIRRSEKGRPLRQMLRPQLVVRRSRVLLQVRLAQQVHGLQTRHLQVIRPRYLEEQVVQVCPQEGWLLRYHHARQVEARELGQCEPMAFMANVGDSEGKGESRL
jgi:hypothetical protein